MYLKFIGEDGSMGLKQGKAYNVTIYSRNRYIWVEWGHDKICPYESPESFAKNWTKA